ncbi:Phosphoinositide phosphatase SAC3 [Vitis vinifera]|uniref:Phosphoinositide phosphatase SAC3 n=1 Tax=Vitis vinifera TaxID=29760 RepID=A0A438GXU7_VITVI|nr:Phosphoinositide phosphatase SAC3 [Vitis vinifera]
MFLIQLGVMYLKRGVNEKGRVANDVETEQIVFEDVPEGSPIQISSIVQNRGSIPLFWSQETSRLNIKPDIILSKKDQNYEATRLHFENLVKRYGNPIIILNLIKTHEKRPRESILRAEFANAIEYINKDLSEENRLKFLHWDLHRHSRSNVFQQSYKCFATSGKSGLICVDVNGFLYRQVTPDLKPEDCLKGPQLENSDMSDLSLHENCESHNEDDDNLERKFSGGNNIANGNHSVKPPMLQKGVLRTNCIDCLDRTNVAQYAYGLAALGRQLHALGVIDVPKIDLDAPLADDLMGFYERMGDTLAHQYGGSAAHNKTSDARPPTSLEEAIPSRSTLVMLDIIFSERRGQWKAATQSQEFFRTLQRYYSNAYMDAEKQAAINVFLGHFQPQQGKPALWELNSDQLYNTGRNGQTNIDENGRSFFKRCYSDGNILCESSSPAQETNVKQEKLSNSVLPNRSQGGSKVLSESSPEISTSESDMALARYTPSMPRRQLFVDMQRDRCLEDHSYNNEHGDLYNCSNFVDLDWLSSSGNSCEEEPYDRSMLMNSPVSGQSSENVVNGIMGETTPCTSQYGSSMRGKERSGTELSSDIEQNAEVLEEFSDSFVHWVNNGETLCF